MKNWLITGVSGARQKALVGGRTGTGELWSVPLA